MNSLKVSIFSFLLLISNSLFAQETGEFAPHFVGKDYRFVGNFHGHNAYVQRGEDGDFFGVLKGGTVVADVLSATEGMVMLYRQKTTGAFAIVDPSDPKTGALTVQDLKFQQSPPDSPMAKAWARAVNPGQGGSEIRKGKNQSWSHVDTTATKSKTERAYIGTHILDDSGAQVQYSALLVVTEQRYLIYIDQKQKQFAAMPMDMFGTPLEDIHYKPMPPNELAAALLKMYNGTKH